MNKRYALIENNVNVEGTTYDNVVVQIESPMREGLVEIPDYVRPKMIKKDDGTFEFPQSIKDILQAEEDSLVVMKNARATSNTKLLDLGLTQAEATALNGYTPE